MEVTPPDPRSRERITFSLSGFQRASGPRGEQQLNFIFFFLFLFKTYSMLRDKEPCVTLINWFADRGGAFIHCQLFTKSVPSF